jgi:putative toxin-antitoxin system antitoxin component (TIGR02293 family)
MTDQPLFVRDRPTTAYVALARNVDRDGLPLTVLDELAGAGFTPAELGDLVINPRTLRHRRARGEALSPDEAERAVRVGRLLATASEVLGDRQAAWEWLRSPNPSLERMRPIDLLRTEIGARLVEEALVRLEHGMFA